MADDAGTAGGRTDTRTSVLEAALTLFAERGTQQPSLREVARQAGVSLGALQHYFPTREALREGVMQHAMRAFSFPAPLDAIADADMETLLRLGLRGNVAWARAHPRVQRLGTHLAMEDPNHSWPGEAEIEAEILRRVRAAQAAGELREFDPRLMTTLVEVVVNGWSAFTAHYARNLPHIPGDQVDDVFLDFVTDTLLDGLRPR